MAEHTPEPRAANVPGPPAPGSDGGERCTPARGLHTHTRPGPCEPGPRDAPRAPRVCAAGDGRDRDGAARGAGSTGQDQGALTSTLGRVSPGSQSGAWLHRQRGRN